MVLVPNFLKTDKALLLAAQLEQSSQYTPVHALKADGASPCGRGRHVGEEEWLAAPAPERLFRFEQVVIPPNPRGEDLAFLSLLLELQGAPFQDYLETVAGERLGELHFEGHRMRALDFIGPHTDARAGRRLGIVLYLSPSWAPEDGGELVFVAHDGAQTELHLPFNTALIFDVEAHREHEVRAVRGGRSRLTMNGWCLQA